MEIAAFEPWMAWVAAGVFVGFLIVMFIWLMIILATAPEDPYDLYY